VTESGDCYARAAPAPDSVTSEAVGCR